MLATSARMVPDMALAWRELPSALHCNCSPLRSTPTFGSPARAMVPRGPFTEIWPEATFTSTPLGNGIGFFAILDMVCSLEDSPQSRSGDDAKHFAADARSARLAVRHHAA